MKLRIHSSSVLWRTPTPWLVFLRVQQADSGWYEMQDVCALQPDWLTELAPHMYQKRA